eukprot:999370-Pelagomonas_calceolata.AAC.3
MMEALEVFALRCRACLKSHGDVLKLNGTGGEARTKIASRIEKNLEMLCPRELGKMPAWSQCLCPKGWSSNA